MQPFSLTINASVVRLDMNLLDLAVLRDQRIALAALVAENGGAIEGQVEGLGELARGVAQEANLDQAVSFVPIPSKR